MQGMKTTIGVLVFACMIWIVVTFGLNLSTLVLCLGVLAIIGIIQERLKDLKEVDKKRKEELRKQIRAEMGVQYRRQPPWNWRGW